MTVDIIVNFVIRFLVGILFLIAYTYIQKLEDTGCACSQHEYRSFIKTFSMIGIVYLLFTMFISPKMVVEHAGSAGGVAYGILDFVFLMTSIVYFYQTIVYVRFLVNEKCKCSEDMRRELIMWGSIIELVLIVQVLLLSMIIPIIGECSISVINSLDDTRKGVSNVIHNPIDAFTDTPKNVDKIFTKSYNTSKKVLSKAASKLTAR